MNTMTYRSPIGRARAHYSVGGCTTFCPRVNSMQQIRKSQKPVGRGQRHSAAWGKRFGVLALVLLAASWSAAQSSKLSRDLQSLPSGTAVSVLVQYYSQPTSSDVNAAKSLGASNGKGLALVKGYRWTMSRGQLSNLVNKDSN